MRCRATPAELGRFRATIIHRLGLQFDDARLGFLGEVLQRRLDKLACCSDRYLQDMEEQPSHAEITALAAELTVGETYFFRNNEQFRALAEVVLPERMRVHRTPGVLRLLSAGCASGEEAYSMAIVVREANVDPSWQVLIRAVDLNPAVLEKAASARYSSWALRDTPSEVQRKWFRAQGRELALDDSVRTAVKFDNANLASDDPGLWQPAAYDAIFCRNVLMYFSPEQMCAASREYRTHSLRVGSCSLTRRDVARRFRRVSSASQPRNLYYEPRKEASEQVGNRLSSEIDSRRRRDHACGRGLGHTIRAATDRIAALSPRRCRQLACLCARASWNLGPALDFLRLEAFAERWIMFAGPAALRDADVLLLGGVLP